MTGDHHGRTTGRATMLVSAVDEILGTHSANNRTPTDIQESRDRLARLRSSSIGSRREPPVPPGSGSPG
jgi:hypothetical protein